MDAPPIGMDAPPLDLSGARCSLCSEALGADVCRTAAAEMVDRMRQRHNKEVKAKRAAAGQAAKKSEEGQGPVPASVLRFARERLRGALASRYAHMADLEANPDMRGEMLDRAIRAIGESDNPNARRRRCAASRLAYGRPGAEPRRRHVRPSPAARDRSTRHGGVRKPRQRAAPVRAARKCRSPAYRPGAATEEIAPCAAHRGDR